MTSHRTVVLVGPSGSGKTELVAALTGGPPRLAGPLSWSTVTHAGTTLHLLDAPGDPALAGPLLAGLHAADLVLFVLSSGADARTVQLWERCEGRPRVVAVTGLDRPGAEFDEAVALCQRLLGEQVHPLSLPLHGDGPDEAVEGLLDLLSQRLHDSSGGYRVERDPDPQHLPLVHSLRSELVEAVLAEASDESLLDAYLADDVVPADVAGLLHEAVAAGAVQPVLPVSPRAAVGLVELLDVLAASTSHEPPVVTAPDGSPAEPLSGSPHDPYVAQVLQVTGDKALARVLSGTGDGAVAGQVCVLPAPPAGSLPRPSGTVTGVAGVPAVIARGWRVPEPQHPTGLAGPPPAELVARVGNDLTARLSYDGQDVLWTLGPTHAAQLLEGLGTITAPVTADGVARSVVVLEVPFAFARTVISDLAGRHGVLLSRRPSPDDDGAELLEAELPDREVLSYAVALSTITQGTATYTRRPASGP